jgi:UDP-glucuronate 4-epimerase
MRILVTGCAGFIGSTLCKRLERDGNTYEIDGIDCVESFPNEKLGKDRLKRLGVRFADGYYDATISDSQTKYDNCSLGRLYLTKQYDVVIHLAAMAGVQECSLMPEWCSDDNLRGFITVLGECAKTKTPLIYASSSSVYGNTPPPQVETAKADKPLSLYAATKRANELMANAYTELYGFPTLGLRFFTVYGPWGRPDMVVWKFTKALLEGNPIEISPGHSRDFTFVDDIVEVIVRLINEPFKSGSGVLNVGTGVPTPITELLETIEQATGKKAIRKERLQRPGDVPETEANLQALRSRIHYTPTTTIEDGVKEFVKWYRGYHQ